MNIDTGELRKLASFFEDTHDVSGDEKALAQDMEKQQEEMDRAIKMQQETMAMAMTTGFTPVPSELNQAAEKKLAGKDSAMVSLTSGGKLSRWAASERKKKRKTASDSRKKNRSK